VLAHPAEPGLCAYPLPEPVTGIPAVLAWHVRHERDSAHRWLRALVGDTLTSIARDAGSP
jgi:DNA-binding transcriptional LysR family regulator